MKGLAGAGVFGSVTDAMSLLGWPATGIVVVPALVLFGVYLLVGGRMIVPGLKGYESRGIFTRLAGAPLLAYYPFAFAFRVVYDGLMGHTREANPIDALLQSGLFDWGLILLSVAAAVVLTAIGLRSVTAAPPRQPPASRQATAPAARRTGSAPRSKPAKPPDNPFDFT